MTETAKVSMTIQEAAAARRREEEQAAVDVAYAFNLVGLSDEDIHARLRELRESGKDKDQVDSMEFLLHVRQLVHTDPVYLAAWVSFEIGRLAALARKGERVNHIELWNAIEAAAKKTLKGGQVLSPYFHRLRWDDPMAKEYRREGGPVVSLPHISRATPRGLSNEAMVTTYKGSNMLVPVDEAAKSLLGEVSTLLDKALEGLLDYLVWCVEQSQLVDVKDTMFWVARLFNGARLVTAEHLDQRWSLVPEETDVWTRKSREGGRFLRFSCGEADDNLLLADNAVGRRAHEVLKRVQALMDKFNRGDLDELLIKEMFRWASQAPQLILPMEEILKVTRSAGFCVAWRPEFRGYSNVYLLLWTGNGGPHIRFASPAAAVGGLFRDMRAFHPQPSWDPGVLDILRKFEDGCDQINLAHIHQLQQEGYGPRLIAG